MKLFLICEDGPQGYRNVGSRPSLEAATDYASELLSKNLSGETSLYVLQEVARVRNKIERKVSVEISYPENLK